MLLLTKTFAILLFLLPFANAQTVEQRLAAGANAQIGVTVRYDPAYRTIAFPGGDVPLDRGVCTDVIIRAYRAIGSDLQKLVNEDMRAHFDAYPHRGWFDHPDTNIDHRRVKNLAVFFSRHGQTLPLSTQGRDYETGDIVVWKLPGGLDHIGLVSDRKRGDRPMMIHNIGAGAQREDVLFEYSITGHYRYLPAAKR